MVTKVIPSKQKVQIEGKEIVLSNLDKVLWPDCGLTKGELINYHVAMAPFTLPHWANRPLTLTRYPSGIDGESFYQKNCPDYAPEWVQTYPITGDDRTIDYLVANDLATLVWIANQGTIEIHPATYTVHSGFLPSFAIIDLDPTYPEGFTEAAAVAEYTRVILEELGLRGYPKTSGASGIHIYIPLKPGYTFAQTSAFVKFVGEVLRKSYPKQVTMERLVKNRKGVYIDHLQNAPGKTIVGVYSPRPQPGAPVSTPFLWEELGEIHPRDFTIRTVTERVKTKGDLFAPVLTDWQSLDEILAIIQEK